MPPWSIERAGVASWERMRAVRLRALRDTPDAFARTVAEEEALTPEDWRGRLENAEVATFVASAQGCDLGLVVGAPYRGRVGVAGLFGLWVAPEARGAGVASALVDAVVQWAREGGYERVVLEVADQNAAAVRLYERKGFVATGATSALPPPREHVREHERAYALRGSG